jgi:hypothetical protein
VAEGKLKKGKLPGKVKSRKGRCSDIGNGKMENRGSRKNGREGGKEYL